MKKTMMSVALTASLMAGSASATTITDLFSNFWVLGDSLSAFGGPVGGETTARASNGPLWSEQIIADFEAVGKDAQSYAVGGATAGLARDIDLAAQTDRLLTQQNNDDDKSLDKLDENSLVAIWIGGNDIGAFQAGLNPFTSREAYAASLNSLLGAGVRNFLLFEVPNVGFTPLVRSGPNGVPTPETEAASIVAAGAAAVLNGLFFNGLPTEPGFLPGVIAGLGPDVNTTLIDTFDLTEVAYDEPTFFGAQERGPCSSDASLACEDATFWDPFHPTALVHDFVADEVREAYLAPVPLPAAGWMLLAAFGGLAALRRRQMQGV